MSDLDSIPLQTAHLCVGYGKHILLEDLNLSMKAGNLICFMGPNGIGKSTLIRTLAGLQKQLSGSITRPSSGEVQHQLSVVLTDKITSANMTALELISFGRYPYLDWNIKLSDEDRAIIQNAIAQVHLEKLIDKRLYELSDGQLQMVMIARALAQDTPVIILDEPTAHLDLNNRVEIMKVLRNLARKANKAILVATHELDLALQMADEIWLTGKNKNILTGIPEDLILSGTFDEIFQFKGFDLKTGKVQHEAHRGKTIQLTGEGYEYLWTKNALERSGYEVVPEQGTHTVSLIKKESNVSWILDANKSFISLRDLLLHLGKA
jgi:iron complex transport system ATP-binding protein